MTILGIILIFHNWKTKLKIKWKLKWKKYKWARRKKFFLEILLLNQYIYILLYSSKKTQTKKQQQQKTKKQQKTNRSRQRPGGGIRLASFSHVTMAPSSCPSVGPEYPFLARTGRLVSSAVTCSVPFSDCQLQERGVWLGHDPATQVGPSALHLTWN